MTELKTGGIEHEITERLIEDLLEEVDRRFGKNGSVAELAYHNRGHSQDVYTSSQKIGIELLSRGQIKARELGLLGVGAAGHDLVQGHGSGLNERLSAEIVGHRMAACHIFDDDDIERTMTWIKSTELRLVDGAVRQSAPAGDLLAMALCDADLANLGAPLADFWPRALDFERERLGKPQLSNKELNNYIKNEIEFLEGHSFYTAAAAQLFPHKPANIMWLKTQYSQI